MPTPNQIALKNKMNPNNGPLRYDAPDTPDDVSLEIEGKRVKSSQLERSKSILYEGDKSAYDSFRESYAVKFYKEMLQEYQNVTMISSDLFESGMSETTRSREKSIDRKNFKLNVSNSPVSDLKKKSSKGGEEYRESRDSYRSNRSASGSPTSPSKDAKSQKSSIRRDPRRLIPIRVEDRSGRPRIAALKKKQNKEDKEIQRTVEQEKEKERQERIKERRQRWEEKRQKIKAEREFGIERIEGEELADQTTESKGKKVKKIFYTDPRKEQMIDADRRRLVVPSVLFKEIDSDGERDYEAQEDEKFHQDRNDNEPAYPTNKTKPITASQSKSSLQQSDFGDYSRASHGDGPGGRELSYNDMVIEGEEEEDHFNEEEEEDEYLVGIEDPKKREEIIAYRERIQAAIEEERKLDEYRSIVRRVWALRSYKIDPTAPIKEEQHHTDIERISTANFHYQEDEEVADALYDHEFAVVKQIESESLIEVVWRGFITTFGKKQVFFVENLIPCKGCFKGTMIYEDTFYTLSGNYVDKGTNKGDHMPFQLCAFEEKRAVYRMKGRFVKYDLEITMEKLDTDISIPMTLNLSFKSVPCTIYSEPYKTIYTGRAKLTHVLLVLFYINDKLNVFCGKANKQGAFVVQHMRDGHPEENIVLKQTRNPSRVHNNHCITLIDEKSQIGYCIEMYP